MAVAPLTVAELERWELFGATWRAHARDGRLTVDLCTCTGELVETREVIDPQLRAWVMHAGAERGTAPDGGAT